MDTQSLLAAISRHRKLLLMTAACIFLLGLIVIYLLPNVYSSTAKIVVERANLLPAGAGAKYDDNISQRMHAIIASVLSSDNIGRLLDEYEMVDGDASDEDRYSAIEQFREQAIMEFDNVAVINQYTGKTGMFSMGLLVEFQHGDPDTAFKIAQELTNDVLQANEGKGEESIGYRTDFLSGRSKDLEQKLAEAEKKVAAFKNENALYLPEVHAIAIRRINELENKIERANDNLDRLETDRVANAQELGTASKDIASYNVDGTRNRSPDELLRDAETELSTKLARYSQDHPEIKALQARVDGLRALVGSTNTASLESKLRRTRQDLAAAKQRYSSEHPNVIRLERELRSLQAGLDAAAEINLPRSTTRSTSPEYNRLKIRQDSIREKINSERRSIATLQNDLDEVQLQLQRMPMVEQQLTVLERERMNIQTSYQDIISQLNEVQIQGGLVKNELLDKFVLVERPVRAFKPTSPKRKLLIPVLFILSIGCGMLLVILRYLSQDKLWQSSDVEAILDAPVLLVPKF